MTIGGVGGELFSIIDDVTLMCNVFLEFQVEFENIKIKVSKNLSFLYY